MPATHTKPYSIKKIAFLAAYSRCGVISRAAKAAKVRRTNHYDWLKSDPNYPALFEQARNDALDSLLEEARRRAFGGVMEPVFYNGKVVGHRRKYSDLMLAVLLRFFLPEKYGPLRRRGKNARQSS